jgi:hypothetical protein
LVLGVLRSDAVEKVLAEVTAEVTGSPGADCAGVVVDTVIEMTTDEVVRGVADEVNV